MVVMDTTAEQSGVYITHRGTSSGTHVFKCVEIVFDYGIQKLCIRFHICSAAISIVGMRRVKRQLRAGRKLTSSLHLLRLTLLHISDSMAFCRVDINLRNLDDSDLVRHRVVPVDEIGGAKIAFGRGWAQPRHIDASLSRASNGTCLVAGTLSAGRYDDCTESVEDGEFKVEFDAVYGGFEDSLDLEEVCELGREECEIEEDNKHVDIDQVLHHGLAVVLLNVHANL